MKLRILLADDEQFACFGLRQLIRSRTPHQIVGEAANGEEAVQMVQEKQPDMVIMDAAMPGMDGVEATRRILEQNPKIRILVVSMHDEEKWVHAMFQAGARGFILKESSVEILKEAIETVAAGKYYVDEGLITDVVMRDYVRQIAGPDAKGPSNALIRRQCEAPDDRHLPQPSQDSKALASLTDRERDVLQRITEDIRIKEIADRLDISTRTVHAHCQNIMQKLGLHTITGLAAFAAKRRLAAGDARHKSRS